MERFDLIGVEGGHGEVVGMAKVLDGRYVLAEEAEAEIAKARQEGFEECERRVMEFLSRREALMSSFNMPHSAQVFSAIRQDMEAGAHRQAES